MIHFTSRSRVIVIFIGGFLILTALFRLYATLASTDQPLVSVSNARDIPTQVSDTLQKMSAKLTSTQQFVITLEITDERNIPSQGKVTLNKTATVTVKKPDKIMSTVREGIANKAIFFNGKDFVLFDADRKLYAQFQAPGRVTDALDQAMTRYGFIMPMADFLIDNVQEGLTAGVKKAEYLKEELLEGQACHHLKFIQESIDWELWIDSTTNFPKQILIVYKKESNAPVFKTVFKTFEVKDNLTDEQFVFKPEAGTEKISFLAVGEKNPFVANSKAKP